MIFLINLEFFFRKKEKIKFANGYAVGQSQPAM